MERQKSTDVAEMEQAARSGQGSGPSASSDSSEGRGAEPRCSVRVVTPPEPERDVFDLIDDGIDFADRLLFGPLDP